MRDQGSGIPRWVTVANLLAIVVALFIVVPQQVRATHTGAPEGLTVIARFSQSTPKLVWRDASQGVNQGYILQRSTTSDFSSSVVELRIARNTLDFVDETQTFNKTFYYRVFAVTATDRSAPSNVAIATNGSGTAPTRPAAPDNLSVGPESSGLRIRWRNNATNEYGIWVQRSGDNGTTWEFRASLSLDSSTFYDSDPPAGAPMYRVWSFNTGGLSPSYAVQYANANTPNPSVPGVPTVPNVGSVVPSNLPTSGSLIPTVPGVPTVPTVPGVPTVPALPTGLLSIVPSNPATIVPTPTLPVVPDPNKGAYWIGVRDINKNYLAHVWVYPASCSGVSVLSVAGRCAPPDETLMFCNTVPFLTAYQYCVYSDFDLNS